jgi:hypothetical protein
MDEHDVHEGPGDETDAMRGAREALGSIEQDDLDLFNQHEEEARLLAARQLAAAESLHGMGVPGEVVAEFEQGTLLTDVIEQTMDVSPVDAADVFVKLPRGYASVEFLRSVYAVGGAA